MTINRVGSYNALQSASFELLRAQSRQVQAQQEVATGKKASDLRGFGTQADVLTAARTVQARVETFIDNGKALSARLESQNLALERVSESINGARQAVGSAISAGRGPTLMKELESWLASTSQSLNMKHDGRYMFSGSNTDDLPVSISNLADLQTLGVAAAFHNDSAPPKSRLDESTTAISGFLADDVGTEFFTILRDIQVYHSTVGLGPLDGPLNAAQETFLRTQLGRLEAAHGESLEVTAQNGLLQNRVESAIQAQQARSVTLEGFLGEITDVDMAEAFTRLEQAQTALQASAYALQSLQKMSLLELLRGG
jgi:flagellar hook-associated protein 3 FlgL